MYSSDIKYFNNNCEHLNIKYTNIYSIATVSNNSVTTNTPAVMYLMIITSKPNTSTVSNILAFENLVPASWEASDNAHNV